MKHIEYCPVKNYALIRNKLKTGDLLLCSGDGLFSDLIQDFTNSDWSHVGMILRVPILDIIMVAESMEGVGIRLYPLSKYLEKYKGKLAIFKHKNFQKELNENKLFRLIFAKLGDQYDKKEILRILFRTIMSRTRLNKIFRCRNKIVKNTKDICSEFIAYIFIKFDILPPYSRLGVITPANFADWQELDFKWRIK